MKFEGIYTPAITPLAADGSIDKAAFAEVLEYLVEAKIHGVIIGGSTGEYYAHTAQERFELAAQAKDVLNGRLPLIVGTGGIRTEDAVAFAKHAKEIKAEALLVGTPPYALPTQQEIAIHVKAVDQAAGLPIMLYNYPGRMSVSMGEEFFDAVADVKNIVAIKESSGDMAQLHRLAIHRPNIAVSCGWDDQALEFFAWGAQSWVCAGSNFIPREHVALYEACVIEKDFAKGRRIMAELMPLMDFLEGGKFVQSIKYGSELQGLRSGGVRAPLQGLDDSEKAALKDVVTTLKRNIAQITGGA
ncbi:MULTISPECIES: dihydrodipicolinate synthase family protein [Pseudomonas]|uniref:4-hydroxy-tetrahydrodipicolinate synthase n=1 Tax=Pseudomonas hunanensis TaxID=1247546 RepID=A0ACC6K258_9PSED|nr:MULTISPECIES: dihydrodipicolinate synthase family protein [Pseudomonas]MBP2261988.1 4-hydroxy-tetrahydrodipicolinate synthase [Pseudomonas sp. BP8]MDR6712505.1 4-hydroxy-tetrahydrodipicolinate synthase [Pseudomonas hunanensis]HDS1735427.1 dihydrodipicolinate synthase family protein [Pseudomonas putida]